MTAGMRWQNVVIICTGVVVVGAVLITALLLGKNGALLAGGLTIIGSAVTGAYTFNRGRRSMQNELQPALPSEPSGDAPKTPPT